MASRGVNKVILVGNLGKDPDMRYTTNGKAVTTFSLAVNRNVRQGDGTYADEVEWVPIVLWEKLAEIANEHLTKGSQVYIEGRLQTRSWEGPDGQKHYKTEVVANDLTMLSNRAPAAASGAARPAPAAAPADDDDDLPF